MRGKGRYRAPFPAPSAWRRTLRSAYGLPPAPRVLPRPRASSEGAAIRGWARLGPRACLSGRLPWRSPFRNLRQYGRCGAQARYSQGLWEKIWGARRRPSRETARLGLAAAACRAAVFAAVAGACAGHDPAAVAARRRIRLRAVRATVGAALLLVAPGA